MYIPPLGRVDYVLTVTNVENTAEKNTIANTFVQSKKPRLYHDKYSKIHIRNCPEVKVHEEDEKRRKKQTVSDIINKTGNIQVIIGKRNKVHYQSCRNTIKY